jgi:hypothetical protein
MTRHDFLLGGLTCLGDLLRIEDLRNMAKCSGALHRPAERELRKRDSLVCFLRPELSLGQEETEEGETEKEDEGR